jgi:hypothetical protein
VNAAWTSREIGLAMLAQIRTRADKVKERTVRGAKVADFNAYWRGGDDLNARLFVDKGAVHDVKEGRTYNGRDFADLCGMTLPEMMEAAGLVSEEERAPKASTTPDALTPDEVNAAWAKLRPTGAEPWLLARGIPSPLSSVESGFAYITEADACPSSVRWWVRQQLEERGPAVVAPIRSARRPLVCSLHLRFLSGGRRHLLRAPLTDEGAPVGYGFAHAAARAELVVLTEGMADTWVGEALARDDPRVLVVGAVDVAGLLSWGRYLSEQGRGRVVVVPHLDKDKAGRLVINDNAVVAVKEMRRHRPAALWSWPRAMDALEPTAPKIHQARDLADMARLASWDALRGAFLTEVRG